MPSKVRWLQIGILVLHQHLENYKKKPYRSSRNSSKRIQIFLWISNITQTICRTSCHICLNIYRRNFFLIFLMESLYVFLQKSFWSGPGKKSCQTFSRILDQRGTGWFLNKLRWYSMHGAFRKNSSKYVKGIPYLFECGIAVVPNFWCSFRGNLWQHPQSTSAISKRNFWRNSRRNWWRIFLYIKN